MSSPGSEAIPNWYAVRCVFQLASDDEASAYEERITIWQAKSEDEAIALAESEAWDYIEDTDATYLGLSQCFHMFESPTSGKEVFSLIRRSVLPPDHYLNAFFDTGQERQRSVDVVGAMDPSLIADCVERIARDVLSSAGYDLRLVLTPSSTDEHELRWFDADVWIDGKASSAFGTYFPEDPEAFTAELADYLTVHTSQTIWGGWPICPSHGTHPLQAKLDVAGQAIWACPTSGQTVARIGDLADAP